MTVYRLLDYETTSFANLKQIGSLNYSRDPSTKILCVATQDVGEDPAPVVSSKIGEFPPDTVPVSWGRFDYEIYTALEHPFPSDKWVDLMAVSRYLGMPGGLDAAAEAFGIDHRKDPRGKRLIRTYCADPTLVIPPEDIQAIEEYAAQDLVVLGKLFEVLKPILPEWERNCRSGYEVTERMNARGVPIDIRSVRAALYQCEAHEKRLHDEMVTLAGLRPTQNVAIAKLLEVESIRKTSLEGVAFSDPTHQRIAQIRLEFAKAATKKLKPMLDMARPTGRAHGCITFNGAHTGRSSSRDIQFQNMKKAKTVDWVFERLRRGEDVGNPLEVIGNNIRGFIYEEGMKLCIADYSQVEARLVAWMAGEPDMLDAFTAGRDVYKEFASKVYKVPVDEVTDLQRAYGKIVVLGAGYGAGGPKIAYQAKSYGIEMSDSQGTELKNEYRRIYARVPQMWENLDDAARLVICGREKVAHVAQCKIAMVSRNALGVQLPSGRVLRYFYPREDQDGITYQSKNGRRKIWGGHFTENFAQAIATDLKLDAMRRLDKVGVKLLFEVHDEIICQDTPELADECLAAMIRIMETPPLWCPRGLIRAEGKVVERYTK